MHIHIFGASGSGVTTLGKALALKLNYPYFDGDHYFWELSDIPFTFKRPPEKRNALINEAMAGLENWVLGGSVVSWHNNWDIHLSVFIYTPHHLRIERLKKREYERYGDIIYTNEGRNKKYIDFISWAAGYDENTTSGRSLFVHENWIRDLKTPLLRIEGDTTVDERIAAILLKMAELQATHSQ